MSQRIQPSPAGQCPYYIDTTSRKYPGAKCGAPSLVEGSLIYQNHMALWHTQGLRNKPSPPPARRSPSADVAMASVEMGTLNYQTRGMSVSSASSVRGASVGGPRTPSGSPPRAGGDKGKGPATGTRSQSLQTPSPRNSVRAVSAYSASPSPGPASSSGLSSARSSYEPVVQPSTRRRRRRRARVNVSNTPLNQVVSNEPGSAGGAKRRANQLGLQEVRRLLNNFAAKQPVPAEHEKIKNQKIDDLTWSELTSLHAGQSGSVCTLLGDMTVERLRADMAKVMQGQKGRTPDSGVARAAELRTMLLKKRKADATRAHSDLHI